MKRFFLLCIIVLALFLRVWGLDRYPATLYGDEQAFAWNAYNILKLGQDEYGNPFPLQFRSFDDYKAPIPFYLLVPFIAVGGLVPFAIRIPIALSSVVTVFFTYSLSKKFFKSKVSLLASFFMAVSPWHIHLSRGYFEATLSLAFFVSAVVCFLHKKHVVKYRILSMILFAASLYSYFTPRILLPLFVPFLFLITFVKDGKSSTLFKSFLYSSVILFVLSLPLLYLSVFQNGLSRLEKLSRSVEQEVVTRVNRERSTSLLISPWKELFHNKATVWADTVKNNYLEHFSVNFWYLYGDNSLRYFLGNMGMFYVAEFPFVLAGFSFLLLRRKVFESLFLLGWLLLAPIPASIVGRSFAVRSLAMLPIPFLFAAYGMAEISGLIQKIRVGFRPLLFLLCTIVFTLLFVSSIGFTLLRYYFEYPVYAATWWGWENKAAIDYVKERENGYSSVFISDFYSGATLAYAVYTSYDPLSYREAINHPIEVADGRKMVKLGKYYFGSLDLNGERVGNKVIPPNSLYIGRPEEPEGEAAIVAPDDGRTIFVVHDTKKKPCYISRVPCK